MNPDERFDGLWRNHAHAVLRYARRRVLPADVDDVVAETFVVAWRRLDDVPERALPWLLGVARGVSANAVRSARRRDALADRVAGIGEHDPRRAAPDTVAHDFDADGSAVSALRRMPEVDRELLTLIAWDQLSQAEAATVIGCSPGALKVRLHRARKRFTGLLGQSSHPRPIALVPQTAPLTGGAQ